MRSGARIDANHIQKIILRVIDNLDFIIRVREIELWLLQVWTRSIIVNITLPKLV
jgi:hypothetical protein